MTASARVPTSDGWRDVADLDLPGAVAAKWTSCSPSSRSSGDPGGEEGRSHPPARSGPGEDPVAAVGPGFGRITSRQAKYGLARQGFAKALRTCPLDWHAEGSAFPSSVRSQRDDPDPHYRAGVVLSIGSRWPRVEGGDASVARPRHDILLILGHTTDAPTSLTCVMPGQSPQQSTV
jgi:hypothetical protein